MRNAAETIRPAVARARPRPRPGPSAGSGAVARRGGRRGRAGEGSPRACGVAPERRRRPSVTWRRRPSLGGGRAGRRHGGARARRGCRPASSPGSRGRAAPGRPAGPRRRRAGGSRSEWRSVCGETPSGRPARRRRRSSRKRSPRTPSGAPRWFRKISAGGSAARRGVAARARASAGRPRGTPRGPRRAGRPSSPIRSLRPLPSDPDLAAPQVERAEVRGRQLADPEPGGVGRLDERPVAQRERAVSEGRPRRVVRRPAAASSSSTPRAARSTWSTSSTRGRRRGRRGVAIAPHGSPAREPVPGREPVERRIAASRWATELRAPDAGRAREIRAEIGARRAAPVDAALGEPVEVAPDGRRVGALRVRRGVPRGEAARNRSRAASAVARSAHARGARSRVAAAPSRGGPSAGERPARGRPVPDRAPLAAAGDRRRPPPRPGRRERRRVRRAAGSRAPTSAALRAAARRAPHFRQMAGSPFRATGPVVGVVERPDRLGVRREVALRVARAAPEDVAGPPRATRDEVAVAVLRADDLERQRVGRRRALLLDVVQSG